MVMSFFRGAEPGLNRIEKQMAIMLGEARHSFDLAMSALVLGVDPATISDEVHRTDGRINTAEKEVRRELIVHSAVQGTEDIGSVLAYMLLVKKIERIGDQAKNILDLAAEGANFLEGADIDDLRSLSSAVSSAFGEVLGLLQEPDEEAALAFRAKADRMAADAESALRQLIHSSQPASEAVPRALLNRYVKRIAANLGGIASTLVDPLDHIDYRDAGQADTDD